MTVQKIFFGASVCVALAACSSDPVVNNTDAGNTDMGMTTTDAGVDMGTVDMGMVDTDMSVDMGPPIDPCEVGSILVTTSDFSEGVLGRVSKATNEVVGVPAASADQDSVPVRSGCTTFLLEHSFGHVRVQSDVDPTVSTHTINLHEPGSEGIYLSNPQAVASISATKAYVTQLSTNEIAIINPTLDGVDGVTGSIDLSGFLVEGDSDGHVDMSAMVVVGTRAYVALGNYTFGKGGQEFPGASVIAVIDTATDMLIDQNPENGGVQGIVLTYHNPVELAVDGTLIYVAAPGAGGMEDGGIEVIDTTAGTAAPVISEETIGGTLSTNPAGIAFAGGKLFAIMGWSFGVGGSLVVIDTDPAAVGDSVAVTEAHSLIGSGTSIYVNAGATPPSAIRVFSAATLAEVTPAAGPIAVGAQNTYGMAEAH